ncbi:MAG TPA: uroporphyrinogen decarboxylase family protein [Ktedonobacterales bacterium]|nr:uroporphyrinogen decarboxylase family protein [Ktedonobacterales bacterium]
MPDVELQPLLTTVAGSYPSDGLPPRRAIQRAVEDQIAAGVDLISDGQMRGDMIATFASRISGFRLADDGIWEIEAALDSPAEPATVADYAFARGLAGRRAEVKGIVTGPITLALACRVLPSAPYSAPDDPALLLKLAELQAREVAALVAAGARVVQVDEPSLRTALARRVSPELAYDALRALAALPSMPVLHACGDIRDIAEELLILPFAVLDIENTRIANLAAMDPDELEFATMRVSVGCVDTQSAEIETIDVIRERIQAAASILPPERLWVSPDCGLRLHTREVAREKLARMVAAAKDVRAEL